MPTLIESKPVKDELQLSIVSPAFNERNNVPELVRRLLTSLAGISWEIVFVDDDSPDGTADVVRELARTDRRVRCIQRVGRRGLSSACIEGMLSTSAEAIVIMDADLQHDETRLPEMLRVLKSDPDVDLVIGTRYAAGGSTGNWSGSRTSISRLATRMSRLICKQDVSDPMSGFFMIRRSALQPIVRRLSGIGFKILLDIIASSQSRLRIREVAYTFRMRETGESKLDSGVIWDFGLLLGDKIVGRYIPVRFLSFALVGVAGLFVHMSVLTSLIEVLGIEFPVAQATATTVAMVFNYSVNNALTYRDRRLRGMRWFGGLLSFMVACSIGALANVGVASYIFERNTTWFWAALAGVLVGAVWNYVITRLYTWEKPATSAVLK